MASGCFLNFLIFLSPRVGRAFVQRCRLCRGQRKNLEFPDTAGLPEIPASRVLREELLKDLRRPVPARKELTHKTSMRQIRISRNSQNTEKQGSTRLGIKRRRVKKR